MIDTTRNYQQMAEDMVGEALFPTLTVYTTFPTSAFTTQQRLKGSLDFDLYTSDAGFPLIRWRYTGVQEIRVESTLSTRTVLAVELAVAHRGPRDIDGGAVISGHQKCARDLYLARHVLDEQYKSFGLGGGAFGIANASVVGGQGSTPLSCVVDVTFGEDNIFQSTSEEDPNNLGPNTWIGEMTVFIHVLSR
jgi:hypothetical protein